MKELVEREAMCASAGMIKTSQNNVHVEVAVQNNVHVEVTAQSNGAQYVHVVINTYQEYQLPTIISQNNVYIN